MYHPKENGILAVLVRSRVGKITDFGIKYRVRVLGSGPHTPPDFSGSTGFSPHSELEVYQLSTDNIHNTEKYSW